MPVDANSAVIPPTWFGLLLFGHITGISLTILRIIDKAVRVKIIWWDDVLAVVSSGITGSMLAIFIYFAKAQHIDSFSRLYLITLSLHFSLVWLTRACITLLVARIFRVSKAQIYYTTTRSAGVFLVVGLTFSIGVNVIYEEQRRKHQVNTGLFSVPLALVLCAILTDFLADAYIVYSSWSLFNTPLLSKNKRYAILSGFSASGVTFVASIVCWVLILTQHSSNLGFHICLVNAMSAVSMIVSNAAIAFGRFHTIFVNIRKRARRLPEQPDDVSLNIPDDIAPLSLTRISTADYQAESFAMDPTNAISSTSKPQGTFHDSLAPSCVKYS
ncbi:hypothetical protein GALMADRAFT_137565 [Galerina marginata CBS 339.88]|uniref:Transmembrane protein n=1 Tax=Galerina marginata (strain CBS 339.88) TaxID=685588 RepID=A0A067TF46_GALM3|nr:hypothetical protein GALMADRAFT_137565 [Galerina marginata CBS 339.88]